MKKYEVSMMQFVGMDEVYRDLVEYVGNNIDWFEDFDVIVGLGRAGTILATIIATMLEKDFVYVDQKTFDYAPKSKLRGRVLVIDDIIGSGRTMEKFVSGFRADENVSDIKILVYMIDLERSYNELIDDMLKDGTLRYIRTTKPKVWILFPWDMTDLKTRELKYKFKAMGWD